jgi:serine acetyltransferase
VTGGRGAVVAAGGVVTARAVVTKDVPPLTIVSGAPAKPIGMRAASAAVYEVDKPSRCSNRNGAWRGLSGMVVPPNQKR